jgi:sugar lactone lactonase YvrE
MKRKEVKCPKCGAENPIYSKKANTYICRNEECEHEFELETRSASKKIFISHGYGEYEVLANKIKEDLEKLNHEVWFDRSKLKAGRDWEITIENGLKGTQIVLVMMTPYSMRRPDGYCLNELSMACGLRKEIVPVMVKDCTPPLSIHRIQWLDFKEWPKISEERYKEKFAQIQDVIEGKILSFEGNHSFLLSKLEPIDFKAEIEKHMKNFFGREWIFDTVKEWLYGDPESRVFFLTGKPGVGKTAISSVLCRRFPEVKAYHLVKFGDTRKSDAIECVLSLAYQLSTQISVYADKLLKINFEGIREKSPITVFDELIVQPLFDLKPPSTPVLIVIDALDEAKKGDDNILVSFLADTFALVPQWLKMFITSRPETDILNLLSSLKPYPLDTEDKRNIADIQGYLQLKLNELFPSKVIDNALEVILERSEGIFLYVREVLNELKLGRLDLDHPEEFPKGLTQVYTNYFKRQFPVAEDYNKYQRPFLELITAAREPLDVDMVYDLLNWDDYDKKLSIDPLGSFLEIIDGKITLFHKSIIEWFTSDQTDIKFYISSKKGHKKLANHGWKIYESDINNLHLYFLTHLPFHLLELEDSWDEIDKLLSDLQYIERCSTKGVLHDILKKSIEAISSKDLPAKYRKKLIELSQLVMNQAHFFRKNAHLTAQQALNESTFHSKAEDDFIKPQEQDPCILTFTGHSEAVNGCAFSPDGTKMVSTSDDQTLKLWDVETGAEIRTFTGHSNWVLGCAFSPDGTKVVSASIDKTLKLWDVETGAEIRTFIGHSGSVLACVFSPDGTKVASASIDKTLKLWDVETGTEIRTFTGHSEWANGCAFSPDGTRVVSNSMDKTLKLWDVDTGAEIRTFTGHSEWVNGCAFSPDGTKVLSTSNDSTLKLWDVETGAEIRTFTGHSSWVLGCAFSPDGTKVISTSSDTTLKLWDVETGAEIRTFTGHSSWTLGCAFSPDGLKLVSTSQDRTLKLWDAETKN